VDLGLLEWVPTLVEGDGPEAEIIHPYGTGGPGAWRTGSDGRRTRRRA
jgi:hypothetical protein